MTRFFEKNAQQVAELAVTGIPLESGLRAMAEEAGILAGKRLKRIADRLANGEPLEKILEETNSRNSRFVMLALKSALESGDPGSVVVELAEYENHRRQLFHSFLMGVAYPIVLLLAVIVLLVLAGLFIVPAIAHTVAELELGGDGSVQIIQWLASHGLLYMGLGLSGILAYAVWARWWLGKPRWRWLLSTLPLIGPVTFWSGAWEFAVRLRILIERSIPVPQALQIVADTCRDANFADVAGRLAQGGESGRSLYQQMRHSTRVPATLTELIGWGESNGQLAESLALATDVFQRRLRMRLEYLTSVLPPMAFIAVAGMAITAAAFVIAPLIFLVQMLSNFGGAAGGPAALYLMGVSTIGLAVFGLALWWTVHVLFLGKRQSPDSQLIFALRIAAVVMIFFGISNVILTVAFPVSLIVVLAIGVVWVMAVNRFRKSETRSLLSQLSLAREHGLPIITAARAFAAERTDEIGLRATRMAEDLERGVSFSNAMLNARFPATTESLFATAFGVGRTEAISTMRESAGSDLAPSDLTVGLLQRLMYLSLLPVFGIFVWGFLCVKIMPSFIQIFDDFELPLPAVTRFAIEATDMVTRGGMPTFILFCVCWMMVLVLSVAVLAILFYYTGWLRWEPPLIRRITIAYHGSIILRTLANAIESQRDIPEAIAEITAAYPTWYVRQRLIAAADMILQGHSWIHALQQQKLISTATKAVLASAERAGNLPWAMREMADATLRRMLLRLNAFVHVVTPIVLVSIALPIGFVAVAIFAPLCNLIMSLA